MVGGGGEVVIARGGRIGRCILVTFGAGGSGDTASVHGISVYYVQRSRRAKSLEVEELVRVCLPHV